MAGSETSATKSAAKAKKSAGKARKQAAKTQKRAVKKAGAAAKQGAPARKPYVPRVELGAIAANGISPSIFGLIERGVGKRPKVAKELRGSLEIRFAEEFATVRVIFGEDRILVEDELPPPHEDDDPPTIPQEPIDPDLIISGSLPQIVQLASAPLFGGLPKMTDARGRAALAKWAVGRVKVEGSALLARRVLKLLEI